ncbi:hypothetical protein [Bacillus pseudomycoides]|nr:hypothetical protein [Bacillus pseudomycoides]
MTFIKVITRMCYIINADHPKGNVFEVIENHVDCIDYEKEE